MSRGGGGGSGHLPGGKWWLQGLELGGSKALNFSVLGSVGGKLCGAGVAMDRSERRHRHLT